MSTRARDATTVLDEHCPRLLALAGPLVGSAATTPLELSSLVAGDAMAGDGEAVVRESPATGQPLYRFTGLSTSQVSQTVTAARDAMSHVGWALPRARSQALSDVARQLHEHEDELAALVVLETGKPIREARGEVQAAVNAFEYFGGIARDNHGRTVASIDDSRFCFTIREPAGVAGLIVPWNFPLGVLCQKLAPALAAGCSVIVKPSPYASLSPLMLLKLVQQAGVPGAAANLALGGATTGEALVAHPQVDVVSFTGSSGVGRAIARTASEHRLKKVAIEAGGNAPAVVFDDADIAAASRGIVFGGLFNQGECCVATSRVIAHEAVLDQLVDGVLDYVQRIRIGDPFDEDTEMGPLITAEHCSRVSDMVDAARQDGAETLGGGRLAHDEDRPGGPYLRPTIVKQPDQSSDIVQEEIFGPVLTVQSFVEDDDALRLANDSKYGLGAALWTRSLQRALDFVQRIRVGDVWVNGSIEAFPELPISGRKDSGFSAEFGREGMEFFSEVRSVQMITEPEKVGLTYGGKSGGTGRNT